MKKLLALCFCLLLFIAGAVLCNAASVTEINDPAVFVKQQTNYTCTLASNVMMLRRYALLRGDADWDTITESTLRPCAWQANTGLSSSFTANLTEGGSISVKSDPIPQGDRTAVLKSLLAAHPEGVVIFNTYSPHAVLLTSYVDGEFYCSDPGRGTASGEIPLSTAASNVRLNTVSVYWHVTASAESDAPSPSFWLDVNGLLDESYSSNLGDFGTCDVYVNGEQVADDVADFHQLFPQGSVYEITDIRPADLRRFHADESDRLTGILEADAKLSLSFTSETPRLMGVAEYNGRTYDVYEANVSFAEAAGYAEGLGCALATVTSAQEQAAILRVLSQNECALWLGASDAALQNVVELPSVETGTGAAPETAAATETEPEAYLYVSLAEEDVCPAALFADGFVVEYDTPESPEKPTKAKKPGLSLQLDRIEGNTAYVNVYAENCAGMKSLSAEIRYDKQVFFTSNLQFTPFASLLSITGNVDLSGSNTDTLGLIRLEISFANAFPTADDLKDLAEDTAASAAGVDADRLALGVIELKMRAAFDETALTAACAVCDTAGTRTMATATAALPGAPAEAAFDPARLGDVNADGSVVSDDARLALRGAVALENLPQGTAAFRAADVDGDGAVTSTDARILLRIAVELEEIDDYR